MIDDWDLLRKWVTDGAQDAFTEIVNRHINFVYASARRRLRDDDAAEDVTQAVFLLLSQRADTLRRRESLPAWLFTAVRYTTANAMKMQRRRNHHEYLAAIGKPTTAVTDDPIVDSRLLDASIDKLPNSDRSAILLRFFQGKSFAEVAAAMGISTDAAEKRVSRAVGRLRKILLGSDGESQAVLSALAISATEVAPPQLGSTVIGTVFAGANASAKITLLARAAGRSVARAAGGFVVAMATIVVLVIIAVSALVAQRDHRAPPPAPAKPVAAAPQPDLIAQALPFDVVVKQPADDSAALLRQAHDGIAAAEQKLRNLRTDSIIKYEKQNSAGQWTSAGEIDQTLWIENTQTERFRDDVHNSVTEWTGGTAPFYREKFIVVYDGSSSKRLTTAGGAPQAFQPHLEGRISASNFGPSGSPWGQTIYGAIDQRTSPPSPKLRLSEALAPGLGASARQVTLNGRECVELALKEPMEATVFVDPSHGWALIGYDWSFPQRIAERYVVKELMPAGEGIEIPADAVGVVMPGQRFELRTTAAVANDPGWSEKLFQLEWPPELTAVWDDRTHTVIRFPAKASPGATQSSGEHGL